MILCFSGGEFFTFWFHVRVSCFSSISADKLLHALVRLQLKHAENIYRIVRNMSMFLIFPVKSFPLPCESKLTQIELKEPF